MLTPNDIEIMPEKKDRLQFYLASKCWSCHKITNVILYKYKYWVHLDSPLAVGSFCDLHIGRFPVALTPLIPQEIFVFKIYADL